MEEEYRGPGTARQGDNAPADRPASPPAAAAQRLGRVLPPTRQRPAHVELAARPAYMIPAAPPPIPPVAPPRTQAAAQEQPRAFPPAPGKWLSPWETERFHLRRAGNLAGFSVLLDLAIQLLLGLLLGAGATLLVRFFAPSVQIGGATLVNLLTLIIYPVSMLAPMLVLKSSARLTFSQACSLRRPQRGYCLPTVALVLGLSTVGVLLDTLISTFFMRFGVAPSTTLNSLGSVFRV